MIKNNDSITNFFPKVCLVTNRNPLSFSIIKLLEKKLCEIVLVTEDVEKLKTTINNLDLKVKEIYSLKEIKNNEIEIDYLVSINIDEDGNKAFTNNIEVVKKLQQINNAKAIFVFNGFGDQKYFNSIKEIKDYIFSENIILNGLIFIGDCFNLNNISYNDSKGEIIFSNFFKVNYKSRSITFFKKEDFCLLNINAVAKEVVRNLFSLKAYGKSTFVESKLIKPQLFNEILTSKIAGVGVKFVEEQNIRIKTDEKVYLTGSSKKELVKLATLLHKIFKEQKNVLNNLNIIKNLKVLGINKKLALKSAKNNTPQKIGILFFTLLLLLILPFVVHTTNIFVFMLGKSFSTKFSPKITIPIISLSKNSSVLVQKYSDVLLNIPFVGLKYSQLQNQSEILSKTGETLIFGLETSEDFLAIYTRFISGNGVNSNRVKELNFDLETLYKDVGFLEAELKSSSLNRNLIGIGNYGESDLSQVKEKIFFLKNIISVLPSILGIEKPQNYLILFQDQKTLRPTGGKIDKIGLITLSGGEAIDYSTVNSNQIDQKLKGNTNPPFVLQKYLNSQVWNFKDVNWDPDFPTSALKAEWFLDKSLGKSVDGVVAINEDYLKNIKTYEQEISARNFLGLTFDKKTNNNDESLYDEFSANFENLTYSKKMKVLKMVYEGLESKDVQVYFNQEKNREVFNMLGWDGSINKINCDEPCYSDLISLNESTLTGTTSKEVVRKAVLTVSFEEKLVKRNLIYFIENNGNEKYEAYLRVIIPGDAGVGKVKIFEGESVEEVSPELVGVRSFKEMGTRFSVLSNSTKTVIFSWESGMDVLLKDSVNYWLSWKKQSGVDSLRSEILFKKDNNVILEPNPSFSLTDKGYLGYNTDLSRDFFSRVFLKKP